MCLAKKGCEGGNCLCRSRKCVKFECTKNTQCKDGCICQENSKNILDPNLTVILILNDKNFKIQLWISTKDNKCVCELDGKKVCRGHKQCTGNNGAQKCVNKICEDVECRNFRHCEKISAITGKDYECTDENDADPNKCVEIECRAHATCGEKKVCIENKCVDTECRVNSVSLSLRL